VKGLSDAALEHLRVVADWPDLSETPYEAVECLGRGTMGTVYRARDPRLGREVALKVLNLEAVGSPVGDRLRAEACILAGLEHPALVPVHDVGTLPDGRVFYVMRLAQGQPLDRALVQSSLPARLAVFLRICDAVAFAHAREVIHRDLKPENVMVGEFGEVLVVDWGLAKLLAESGDPVPWGAPPSPAAGTSHGTVLGTPGYMAPEQARGEVELVDRRADIHALGGLLAFLLTRRHPSETGGLDLAGVPRPLAAVIAHCRAARPQDRYDSVAALRSDVAAFLEGAAVAAFREGPLERGRRLIHRHRTPVLLVLTYLLVRVVLIFLPRG
jgi:eukaryotic-like serine/threonine-protein kinase